MTVVYVPTVQFRANPENCINKQWLTMSKHIVPTQPRKAFFPPLVLPFQVRAF